MNINIEKVIINKPIVTAEKSNSLAVLADCKFRLYQIRNLVSDRQIDGNAKYPQEEDILQEIMRLTDVNL